jgi:hypothetical protein
MQAITKTCATCKYYNLLLHVIISSAAAYPVAFSNAALHNAGAHVGQACNCS